MIKKERKIDPETGAKLPIPHGVVTRYNEKDSIEIASYVNGK
jgi:hypothetical protein